MRSMDLLKFFFELISLIILIVLVAVFIEAIIGSQYGTDFQYKQYTKVLAQVFSGSSSQLSIPSYNLEYVPVLVVQNNEYYMYMYKCSYNINSELPSMTLWNVSSLDNAYLFAPDLSQCLLLAEQPIDTCNNNNGINVYIKSLGGDAGYVAVPTSSASLSSPFVPYIVLTLLSPTAGTDISNLVQIFSNSPQTYVFNQTQIECSCSQCNIEYNGNYGIECYLSYGDNNIKACAELFGLIIPNSNNFFSSFYTQNIISAGTLNINNNNYPYIYVSLSQFIDNPILLVENQNGQIYFYYEIPLKQ